MVRETRKPQERQTDGLSVRRSHTRVGATALTGTGLGLTLAIASSVCALESRAVQGGLLPTAIASERLPDAQRFDAAAATSADSNDAPQIGPVAGIDDASPEHWERYESGEPASPSTLQSTPNASVEQSTAAGVDALPVGTVQVGPGGKRLPLQRTVDDSASLEPDFTAPGDIWSRMRASFGYFYSGDDALAGRARVDAQIEWLQRHHVFGERNAQNLRRFLPYIVSQAEARNLPLELALVPLIESAFRPMAKSSAGALGVWQFMPATGRRYGLEAKPGYDGRLDVVASTRAALDMLESLHRQFEGDWLLAIAAYNAGDGAIRRAIERNRAANQKADFWSLKVPKETALYVPRVLAASEIVDNPGAHGVALIDVSDEQSFEVVELDRSLTIEQAAALARVGVKEIEALNTGYVQGVTLPSDDAHRLLVPLNRGNVLLARIGTVSRRGASADLAAPDDSWRRHRIQPGESLIAIARRYRTSVMALRAANRVSGSYIRAGSSLLVPASYVDTTSSRRASSTTVIAAKAAAPAETQVVQASGLLAATLPAEGAYSNRLDYRVREGDSLWHIAERFRVTVSQLRQWNALGKQRYLRPGQVLEVYIRPAQET